MPVQPEVPLTHDARHPKCNLNHAQTASLFLSSVPLQLPRECHSTITTREGSTQRWPNPSSEQHGILRGLEAYLCSQTLPVDGQSAAYQLDHDRLSTHDLQRRGGRNKKTIMAFYLLPSIVPRVSSRHREPGLPLIARPSP